MVKMLGIACGVEGQARAEQQLEWSIRKLQCRLQSVQKGENGEGDRWMGRIEVLLKPIISAGGLPSTQTLIMWPSRCCNDYIFGDHG